MNRPIRTVVLLSAAFSALSGCQDAAPPVTRAGDPHETSTPQGQENRSNHEQDHEGQNQGKQESGVILVPIIVEDRQVQGPNEVGVEVGASIRIDVRADVAAEVHVQGYDQVADVNPGKTTSIEFTADIPGVFRVELEESHLLLFELRVQ